MTGEPIIDRMLAYLPPDRAVEILGGSALPVTDSGAVLFSDISGFTQLTEVVIARYGPRLGGEQFTDCLNAVYDALISEVVRFGGSIVGFAGDAMVVWFAGDTGAVAVTAALNMQRMMRRFDHFDLPDGDPVSLGMKVAIATGPVRRMAVGDPSIQLLDVMAGDVMELVSACEGVARRGEIAVDAATAVRLESRIGVREWRSLVQGDSHKDVAIIGEMKHAEPARLRPLPPYPPDAVKRVQRWLLPDVARRIASDQDVFLTELRPATALFVRFSGLDFERDEAAPDKLDGYVKWLQRIIADLEGVLVQLTIGEKGSYFYAAWGAPVAHDDDTMRACTAALQIVRPPPKIAAFITSTQAGITRGTMRTGAYGNHQRRTYGVLGDDTNLSARLMTKAGPDEILVSSHAARRQHEAFDLLPLPKVTVKGKTEPVAVFRLLGRKQTGTLSRASMPRNAAPMVGRDREYSHALELLRLAKGGRGQGIALDGPAGMGKTRLLSEVVRSAGEMGFTAFAGDCPALVRDATYSVWIPIWRSFFDIPPDADATAALANLERHVTANNPGLRDRAPLLGPLLNIALPDNELTRTLDPKVRRSSLEDLVVECIRHRARSGPLMFVLEECHWIDEASRDLLATILRAISRLPVALMLAHRPVESGSLVGGNDATLDYFTTIHLGDLPPDDARTLVETRLAAAFGTSALPDELVDLITSRADGNPFFIEEVVNLLKARGASLDDPRELVRLELPESVHSLALGRIDQLNEETQTTLKIASVIGRHFRTAVLFGVHPLERAHAGIPEQLGQMQERDIALHEPVDGEDAYLFKHILVQEVAYESLPFAFRTSIHEKIGNHIERAAGGNLRPWTSLLAFHYGRSNRDDKKRHYFVAAADEARGAYALQSAISFYERALALLSDAARIDVLAHLGEVLELSGRWDEASKRYHEAREQAAKKGLRPQAAAMASAIGDLHRKRGEFTEAQEWIRRAREESEDLGDQAGVALTLHLEGTLSAQTGNFARAADLYRQTLAVREQLGDETGAAKTLNNLGIVARSQGDIDTALDFYERSLAIRRRLKDRREIANSLNNLGFTRRFRKEFGRARELLEESLQLNRSVGDRWSTANALTSLAELALDTGDTELARRCLGESITINRALGDRRAIAFLLEGFGQLGRLKNDPAAALLFFASAHALREAIGAPLEPADAERVGAVLSKIHELVPPEVRDRVESEGRTMPLDDVLDHAMTFNA